MKKGCLVLLLLLLVVSPTTGQQPATALTQCRADWNAWNLPPAGIFGGFASTSASPSDTFRVVQQALQTEREIQDKFSNLATTMTHDPDVTAKTLDARIVELQQCAKMDAAQTGYDDASRAYTMAELGRMADFIQRHKLTQQFYLEDSQGQR